MPSGAPRHGREQVLYSFGGLNGAGPLSGVIREDGGVLVGTTVFGGEHGNGDVFMLAPQGSGYRETILHTFGGGSGGSRPGGNVAESHGDLFGVTIIGGADQQGTAFELVPSGSGYVERVIHTFTGGADGGQPIGTPVIDRAGNIYGVTQFGGSRGGGVAFELSAAGAGYHERVLHDFSPDGSSPAAGLTLSADGTLLGTSYGAGGGDPYGSVFRLRPDGPGYAYRDLYDFKGGTDGADPFAAVTLDSGTGAIFGTTEYGGGGGDEGTVFELDPSGAGYTEEVLHRFTQDQGALLEAPLLLEPDGDLAGTASQGGGTGCGGSGCGTAFEVDPTGPPSPVTVLYRFTGPPDGAEPEWAPLVAEPDGNLLGTTRSGGTVTTCGDGGPGGVTGCGTLYQLTP